MNRIDTFTTTLIFAFAITLPVNAEAAAKADDWKYAAEFYLWGANIDVKTTSGTNTEIRFTHLAENLDFAAMALLAAQRGRWQVGVDLIYLDVDANVKERLLPSIELRNLGLEVWVVTPMVGYRVLELEHTSLHVIAGAPYLWIDLSEKFDFSAPLPFARRKASQSGSVWDGIVGVRGQWKFSQIWYTSYHFDIGSGESDSTWQALAAIGYRYLDWDPDDDGALDDLDLSGAMVGIKFFF